MRVLLAGLAATLLTVGTAQAASPHPTLIMSPTAPVVGDYMTFTGCGYDPNANSGFVQVTDNQPLNNTDSASIPVNADGCFDTTGLLFTQTFISGPYKVSATQGGNLWAQINFTVKK